MNQPHRKPVPTSPDAKSASSAHLKAATKRTAKSAAVAPASAVSRWHRLAAAAYPVTVQDALCVCAILFFCFFAFQHQDIHHTSGCSFTYLYGHLKDFYTVNDKLFGAVNYLPSTYVVYALWGIPLYILGLLPSLGTMGESVQFWYKALNVIFFAGSGLLLRGIALRMGFSRARSSVVMAGWLTAPIACFSVFVFGQYDIITVFFFLAAIYCYAGGNLTGFTAWVGVSLTFKYFPLFAYIPMLLLADRRFSRLVAHGVCMAIPTASWFIIYNGDPRFVMTNGLVERVFGTIIHVGKWSMPLLFLSWFTLCAAAYLQRVDGPQERNRWACWYGLVSMSIVFTTIFWHPQWLIFVVPFMVLAACSHERAAFFYFVDFVMMCAFVFTVVSTWVGGVDQALWKHGIFGAFNPNLLIENKQAYMAQLLPLQRYSLIWLALLDAGFLVYCIYNRPASAFRTWIDDGGPVTREQMRPVIWRFVGGLSSFILPAMLTYYLTLHR